MPKKKYQTNRRENFDLEETKKDIQKLKKT